MKPVDPQDARQGHKGNRVIIILVAGLALLAIVFVGLGIYGWALPEPTLPTAAEDSDVTNAPIAQPEAAEGTTVTPQESQPGGESPAREN